LEKTMKVFDTYGHPTKSIHALKPMLELALGVKMVLHESSYVGDVLYVRFVSCARKD
jgi:hypothetical protein